MKCCEQEKTGEQQLRESEQQVARLAREVPLRESEVAARRAASGCSESVSVAEMLNETELRKRTLQTEIDAAAAEVLLLLLLCSSPTLLCPPFTFSLLSMFIVVHCVALLAKGSSRRTGWLRTEGSRGAPSDC